MENYNWKKFRNISRGGFDDGSYISLLSKGKAGGYMFIHAELIKKVCPDAKFVEIFYDEKGFLGFKFSKDNQNAQLYRIMHQSKIKKRVHSIILSYFHPLKYFKGDVEIDLKNNMAIIKCKLRDEVKYQSINFQGE